MIHLYPVGLSHFSQRDFFCLNQTIYMICTKCSIDKPLDQYQTYWHSTQQKTRTRKYCKTCFNEQKKKYRKTINMKEIIQPEVTELQPDPSIDYSTNPEYDLCKQCSNWRHKTEYYLINGRINFYMCKECCNNKDRKERQQYLKENCGSDFVHAKPNHYTDEYQKECVFDVLKVLGYLYDEETGIWTKPGVKELVDGKIVFFDIKNKKQRKKSTMVTMQIINQVLQLRKNNVKMVDIINQVGISENSVYKILKTYSNAKSS